ncbi:MAG: histidine phosphatase family protein [Patescibacteria group bacterium]
MIFVLTRHTTTEWNSQGRIQGRTDIPLSPQGIVEAQELANLLINLGIELIVSSDLKRASQTAAIVNTRLAVPLRLEARLRECSFGTAEGLTRQQTIERCGAWIASSWDSHRAYDFLRIGGERRDSVLARHMHVLKTLIDEKAGGKILLVGHGRGLCTLLSEFGLPPDLKRGEYRILEYASP